MATHMVVCINCGKTFDANKGGYYDRSIRRYTCDACAKGIKRTRIRAKYEVDAREREAATGMRQSKGFMAAKIIVGALLAICSVFMSRVITILVFLAAGAALIAWGLVPYFNGKKIMKERAAEKAAAGSEGSDALKICSCCGAQTKGPTCEYCGTPLK